MSFAPLPSVVGVGGTGSTSEQDIFSDSYGYAADTTYAIARAFWDATRTPNYLPIMLPENIWAIPAAAPPTTPNPEISVVDSDPEAQTSVPVVGIPSVAGGQPVEVVAAVEPISVWIDGEPSEEELFEEAAQIEAAQALPTPIVRGTEGPGDYGYAYPAETNEGDEQVAIDWNQVLTGVANVGAQRLINPSYGELTRPTTPAKVTVDTRTGAVTPCRRRRRRRLLTPTDLADLASLQTLVGKGSDAMRFAVTKAVRR